MSHTQLNPDKIQGIEFLISSISEKEKDSQVPKHCLFLGAGASISSGIPSGRAIIELLIKKCFAKTIPDSHKLTEENLEKYISLHPKAFVDFQQQKEAKFKDKINRHKDYFVKTVPENLSKSGSWDSIWELYKEYIYNDNLYGNWFEEFSEDERERQSLIETIIDGKDPSGFYVLLANIVKKGLFRNIFTSNFDDLPNISLIRYENIISRVYAHNELANHISIYSRRPNIIKVHGDYLFENKNTPNETNNLSDNIQSKFKEALERLGLIVIGYSGADNSIMSVLEQMKKKVKYPLIWCGIDESNLNWRVINLINETQNSWFVKIEGFDQIVTKIWVSYDCILPSLSEAALDKQKELDKIYASHITPLIEKSGTLTQPEKTIFDKKVEANKYYEEALGATSNQKKIELYSKVIDLDPNHSKAFGNRGSYFYIMGEYNKALVDLNKSIETNPTSFTLTFRGNTYFALGNKDAAIDDFNKAIQIDPNYSYTYSSRGKVHESNKDWEQALADYNKAIELDPSDWFAFSARGNFHFKQTRYSEALNDLNTAINFNPDGPYLYKSRGDIFKALGDHMKANADFEKAQSLSNKNA